MNKLLFIEKRVKTYHFALNFLRFSEKYFTSNFVPMVLQKLTQLKDVYNLFLFKKDLKVHMKFVYIQFCHLEISSVSLKDE